MKAYMTFEEKKRKNRAVDLFKYRAVPCRLALTTLGRSNQRAPKTKRDKHYFSLASTLSTGLCSPWRRLLGPREQRLQMGQLCDRRFVFSSIP